MLEQGLTNLLANDAGLAALIAGRVYPICGPIDQPQYPYLTYLVVSSASDYALDKSQCGHKRIQFDAWGTSYADCKTVLNALRNALDTFVGTLNDGTRVLSALSGIEFDQFENDSRAYRSIAEYELTFVEP